ncbi:MAG: hypothetical protein HY856_06730, partial [Burkholderiales bacterium]|nr:hypothetical protein [Burkholderiales bacterium]
MTARHSRLAPAVGLLMAATVCGAVAAPGDETLLDDFRDASRWQASASDQVQAALRPAPTGGLCLDYDFRGVSGYAVARRPLDIALPANYEFRLRHHGQGEPNHFQFKLTDASGDNVWWLYRPDGRPPAAPTELRIRQRQIEFAWGPTTDKRLRRPAALERVVASGQGGGRGAVCFERLSLVERAPVPAAWPTPQVVAAAGGAEVHIELGALREFSGLQLHWGSPGARWRDYAVEADDGRGRWQPLAQVHAAAGPVDALFLPDAEARRLRLRPLAPPPRGPATLPRVTLVEAGRWRSPDAATAARAQALPRGAFPRAYLGEQNYWTLVGVDGGARWSALMSEDGAIEPAPGAPSLEPFVLLEGREKGRPTRTLVSWADVQASHHLAEGYLPQPRVRWTHPAFTLDIEAGASGTAGRATGLVRYRLRATGTRPLTATLLLVQRPWQVNPPQQFLNRPGGHSPIATLRWQAGALSAGPHGPAWHAVTPPARV